MVERAWTTRVVRTEWRRRRSVGRSVGQSVRAVLSGPGRLAELITERSRAIVARESRRTDGWVAVRHDTRHGERVADSRHCACSTSHRPPLSLEKMTSVLSNMPRDLRAATMRPMLSSTALIIARHSCRGL